MIIRPAPLRPAKFPLGFGDGEIVDAGVAGAHVAERVELPVLIAVRTKPVACVVVRLVGEAHGDAVFGERPQLFDQAILIFVRPLAREELDNRGSPGEKL